MSATGGRQIARRAAVLLLGAAVLAAALAVKLPQSVLSARGAVLDPKGLRALAILIFALVLWIGEALPFHITGILAMLLSAALGVQPWGDLVKSGLGDEAVIFFIAVLLLASALSKSGLAGRFIAPLLRLTRGNTRAVIFTILVAGALLSMWLTALAAAAIVLPSAKALLDKEGLKPGQSRFGTALAMAVAWGPLIGACATPAGSGSNPVVVRFLAELAGYDISFVRWMSLGLPLTTALLPIGWLILILLFPPEARKLSSFDVAGGSPSAPEGSPAGPASGSATAHRKIPFSREEKASGVIFAAVAVLWLISPVIAGWTGFKLSVSYVACIGAIALFLPGATGYGWKDLERSIDWAGILLIASGISLGTALYRSGAAAWVSAVVLGGIGSLSPFGRLFAVSVGVLLIKVVFSSNTLTGTVIVPLIIALGATLGLDARTLALAGGFAANFAVILVTTSPVNVLPWSTGFFSVRDMAKAGVIFAPFVALAIAAVFSLLGPAA